MQEIILTPIPSDRGFSNYLVDTINGRVWSKKRNKWLTNKPNDNGYIYNTLTDDNGMATSFGVHRVVIASYTGINIENFMRGKTEVDHIQEDLKHVNGIHNLQMTDRRGQYRESIRLKMGKGKRLEESEVCEILEQLQEWKADGKKLSTFIHMVAEAYEQTYRNIHNIVYRKSWRHLKNRTIKEVA
ncbi:hypothetical protein P4J13_25260 [Bacillus anthracis]|uniref:hypothetical protein n=1 Tax=Bacillus anthracis TaxID=1392 RepID=UPI002DB6612E|nr:hypothetical protein [Bacillus anthracis]MEB9507243.1 hypothetical protein [Bacillus anthracis]